MTEPISHHPPHIDPAILTDVVRQHRRDATFTIRDWQTTPLSAMGIVHPEGLLRVSGTGRGRAGGAAWEVVLKHLPFTADGADQWEQESRRELALAQTGFFRDLPGPLTAPTIYHASQTPTGGQIWMELVHDASKPRWTLDEYVFAAREIGRFQAACLGWTSYNHLPFLQSRHWHAWFEGLFHMPPEQVWSNPYVRKNIPPDLRARVERLFADREMFYQALDALPQVIGHYDLHRRNLLIRPREDGRELVAIDWPNTGLGALGAEFYGLLGAGSIVFEIDGFYLPTYDRALFPAFLAGLRDGGWRGPEEEIRLAYTAWLALWLGPLPMSMALWTAPDMLDAGRRQFGCGPDEYAAELVYAFRYALDCADEARAILG